MYKQLNRFEKRIAVIEEAAQHGKFSVKLHLYPSEYRKLKEMGFDLGEPPISPFNNSQLITVSWKTFSIYSIDENAPFYMYCFLKTENFPDTNCYSDSCFIKAIRFHLKNYPNSDFIQALADLVIKICFVG